VKFLTPHLYKNCVVMFIVVAAVIGFTFGVLEGRITESEPSVYGMCCNM